MIAEMTSRDRVLTALSQLEPDRVPFFLPVTMHGADEVGMPLSEYFRDPAAVAEGQLRLRARYRDDIVYPFFYAAVEHEAFGGEVQFFEDGPPNAAGQVITDPRQILDLVPPRVDDSPALLRVLDCIGRLRDAISGEALIVGVIMSPFSLPVMQMGFDHYLDLLHEQPDLANRLHRVNEEFSVQWANAQLAAGADAIGYFDPVSSPTIVPPEMFRQYGLPILTRSLSRINGPVAALLASGRALPILADLAETSAAIVGVGNEEDLRDAKVAAGGRITIMGNLNALEMRRWTADDAEAAVKDAIARGGPDGGFILSDAHGEIPIQVPQDVLLAVSEAVHAHGRYPLDLTSRESA
jgi:uroporphyrinogen decarboxylase